jgi:hypothetical protein
MARSRSFYDSGQTEHGCHAGQLQLAATRKATFALGFFRLAPAALGLQATIKRKEYHES